MQPSTVSAIGEQLLKEGWVREGALVKTARGRRPTLLSLNDDLVFLVADVRPSWAVVALVNLNGHFLERQLLPLGKDAERSMKAIADVMQSYRETHASKGFEGVGLSMPGSVNPETNELLLAPHLRWNRFALCEYLTARWVLRCSLRTRPTPACCRNFGLGGETACGTRCWFRCQRVWAWLSWPGAA